MRLAYLLSLEFVKSSQKYAWIGATNGISKTAKFRWLSDHSIVSNESMAPGEPNAFFNYWGGLTVFWVDPPTKRIGDSPGEEHRFAVVCEALNKNGG